MLTFDVNLAMVHPRVLDEEALKMIMNIGEIGKRKVFKLCSGEEKFRMSVPVNIDDTDIAILNALECIDRMVQEVYRLRGELKVALVEDLEMTEDTRKRLERIVFS